MTAAYNAEFEMAAFPTRDTTHLILLPVLLTRTWAASSGRWTCRHCRHCRRPGRRGAPARRRPDSFPDERRCCCRARDARARCPPGRSRPWACTCWGRCGRRCRRPGPGRPGSGARTYPRTSAGRTSSPQPRSHLQCRESDGICR